MRDAVDGLLVNAAGGVVGDPGGDTEEDITGRAFGIRIMLQFFWGSGFVGVQPRGGGRLGWVVARTAGGFPRPVCPSLTSTTGPYPGCLVSQPPRLLTIPEPHHPGGGGGRTPPPPSYNSEGHPVGYVPTHASMV